MAVENKRCDYEGDERLRCGLMPPPEEVARAKLRDMAREAQENNRRFLAQAQLPAPSWAAAPASGVSAAV